MWYWMKLTKKNWVRGLSFISKSLIVILIIVTACTKILVKNDTISRQLIPLNSGFTDIILIAGYQGQFIGVSAYAC